MFDVALSRLFVWALFMHTTNETKNRPGVENKRREERERNGRTDGREKMVRARVRNVNKAFWETFIIARQARTRHDDLIKVSLSDNINVSNSILGAFLI